MSVAAMRGWGSPEEVAAVCGVSPRTVRTWARRLVVASACDLASGRLVVRWVDAEKRIDSWREAS